MQKQDTLSRIYAPIDLVMAEVRDVVSEVWRDALALVSIASANEVSQQAEGKLLRPALCMLAAGGLGETELRPYVNLAAAYETMHIASLTHDDVVDNASVRRGQNALNVLWSNHAAILGGDYLVARALELLAEYNCGPLLVSALNAMRCMAEGELRFYGHDPDTASETDCIDLAECKTASLFAAACSAPAYLVAPDKARQLHDFGIHLGVAFQLVDDLLDITQTQATLGKPACGDIAEGKHTLPLHLLRAAMNETERKRLASLRGATVLESDALWVARIVSRLGVERAVLSRARNYIETGIASLTMFPESPYRESIIALARFVLDRHA